MDELGWESDPKKRRAKGKGKCGKAGDLMNLINSPGHRY